MYLDDHAPFCRFVPFKCPCCGRGGMFTSQYAAHIERECTTFHKYQRRAGGPRKPAARALPGRRKQKGKDKQWVLTWISKKHLHRAFDIVAQFEARQVDGRADIKIGRAQEEMELRIDESAEHLEGLVSGLHEEEGADNPYAWSIDKLLAFCEANGVRRVSKRKKQAGLVVDFQTRRANAAHEELVVREEGAYVDVETRWNNLRKQVRRLVDSRRTSAEERFDSETFRPK